MPRRYIFDGKLTFIGKETRDLEKQCLGVTAINEYADKEKLKEKILKMTPNEARKRGVRHRSTLKRWKDKIKDGKSLNFSSSSMKRIFH